MLVHFISIHQFLGEKVWQIQILTLSKCARLRLFIVILRLNSKLQWKFKYQHSNSNLRLLILVSCENPSFSVKESSAISSMRNEEMKQHLECTEMLTRE